jgi:redox-sensitive bicupin YhaK (pirin superfamily)
MVGPFIFVDQMGPAVFDANKGIDVRPHPHIGLATVTYLFEGLIVHRDSLGSLQAIVPGDVNWMTAGRGIVHSERSDRESRKRPSRLSGMQTWVALPKRYEETEPAFYHHASEELPVLEGDGVRARVIAGSLFGLTAPTRTFSDLFFADATLSPRAAFDLESEHEERGAYLVDGTIEVDGQPFEPGRLLVFAPNTRPKIASGPGARIVLLGGEPMDGPRHLWWNLVSSSKDRIEQAKEDWKRGRFGAVPGETEFIPLPD